MSAAQQPDGRGGRAIVIDFQKAREKFPNAGKAWSDAQDETLRELYDGAECIPELAKQLGRTEGGVRARLLRLGMITHDESIVAH